MSFVVALGAAGVCIPRSMALSVGLQNAFQEKGRICIHLFVFLKKLFN